MPRSPMRSCFDKAKDDARKRKLDNTAQKNLQHGGDPVDVGAVGGWSWYGDVSGEYDYDGVIAVGFKGKGKHKGKGKGDCYSCHFSRVCPYQDKGKSKGTNSKDTILTVERRGTQQGSAPKEREITHEKMQEHRAN